MDWSTFTCRINTKANKDHIFKSWLSQDEIEKWFLSSAVFTDANGKTKDRKEQISKGDTYVWMWHESDFVAEGEVLDTNQDTLIFTFLGCTVTITTKHEGGQNIIELVQSKIPTDEESKKNLHVGCSKGWTFYLANLKSYLEGGLDLRNKSKGVKDVVNT